MPSTKGNTIMYEAKKAMKLPVGSVIKTGKRSKVKLIYPNGDQISVGSETFLKFLKVSLLQKSSIYFQVVSEL